MSAAKLVPDAEYHLLLAERSALERMIAETPAEDVIDLNSLKARLDIVNRQIAGKPMAAGFHEASQSLYGSFEGVLPKRRTFEFRLTDSGEIISGKIGPTISDPAAINRHLYQPIRIEVVAMRVGQGRARYVLNTMPQWSGTSGDESESDPSDRP